MKLILLNFYPAGTIARYQLSSYILKAYLEKFYHSDNNFSIDILNFSNKSVAAKICEKTVKYNPNYIGYSCYIWNIEKILQVIKILKEKLDAVHILGGPEISMDWIRSLPDPSLSDYYVIGEGEKKILHLLCYLEQQPGKSELTFPDGVAYWNNNTLIYKESHDFIEDLDEIPSIYLNKVIEDRFYARQQAFLETQRGCKWRCKYCVYPKHLPSLTYYSLERIFEEFHYLIVEKQISALRIFDAVFSFDLERAKKIIRYLLELKHRKNVQMPWIYWETSPFYMDEEFIKLTATLKYRKSILNSLELVPQDRPQHYSDMLKDYTAITVIGVQSFCLQALKAVNRPRMNLKRFGMFMNIVREYNIVLKIDLILGLPFETFSSYFSGLEFLLPFFQNTDHILNIHRLQVLPGSEMQKMCDLYGIHYSPRSPHLVFSTQSFTVEEMARATKLTGVLFRTLNSPLRGYFFEAQERMGGSFLQLLEKIFTEILNSQELKESQLIQNDFIDDIYWNDGIFREIPSQWIIDFLENIS